MWIASLGIILALKSSPQFKQIRWYLLLILLYLEDLLNVLAIIFGISQSYATSMFTAISISVLVFLAFSIFKNQNIKAITYGLMPITAYALDIIAFPEVSLVWNDTLVMFGFDAYNWLNGWYLAVSIESVFVIGMFILFWLKTHPKLKAENTSINENNSEMAPKESKTEEISDLKNSK